MKSYLQNGSIALKFMAGGGCWCVMCDGDMENYWCFELLFFEAIIDFVKKGFVVPLCTKTTIGVSWAPVCSFLQLFLLKTFQGISMFIPWNLQLYLPKYDQLFVLQRFVYLWVHSDAPVHW